jgi:hypothetical protein
MKKLLGYQQALQKKRNSIMYLIKFLNFYCIKFIIINFNRRKSKDSLDEIVDYDDDFE